VSARRAGVVTFAGVLFLVVAAFNAVDGVVALADPGHYFVTEEGLVVANYDAFGIVLLIIAGFQFLIGWGILALQRWAQVVGIIVVILNAIAQLAHFTHYPAWATIILILDAVILYALTVYSDEFAPAGRRRR
jgi:hypothetical protein